MNGIIRWFAHHGVAAVLLKVLIIAGGLLTIPGIKKEIFPELPTNVITVSVAYPGAAPEEVEEGICIRIEEQVQGLEDVDRVTSSASEGVGTVSIKLITGADVNEVLDDVKTRIDAIDTFPDEAEEPIVQKFDLRRQVIDIAVSGAADEVSIKRIAERVRDELTGLDGITLVELVAVRPYEMAIEVSEGTLRKYGLTFDQIVTAVRRSSLDLPGGSLETEGGEILLRAKGQAYRARDFEEIPVVTRSDGTRVTLGELATIVDGFEDTKQTSRFDGNPTAMLQVYRVGEQSALEVAATVKSYVASAQSSMPAGIELTTWRDYSSYLNSRMELLIRNARAGIILVFLVLALFLRFRLALWVTMGIPISFLGAMMMLPTLDVSINLISLFAFIVVLGIVVDDAIVVGENIYRTQRMGKRGLEGAVAGAQEVAVPVLFAVATTIAAFTPLLSVPGNIGQIMRVIPLIVIPTLIFSLIESKLMLPYHLSHDTRHQERRGLLSPIVNGWRRIQDAFATNLERFVERRYAPLIDRLVRFRYVTHASFVAIFIISVSLVAGGWVRFVFFPPVEADFVVAAIEMPLGVSVQQTERAVTQLEDAALFLKDDLREEYGTDIYLHMLASVGEQPFAESQANTGPRAGSGGTFSASHLGEVTIELIPSEKREVTSAEISQRWRELTGVIPDATQLTFSSSLFSAGEPINVELAGTNVDRLREAADELKARLETYAGVFDITDSYKSGKQEIKLAIKPEAENLGLALSDLARQVRQGFYGEEAQRIQRGRDDVKVMVRYPEIERESIGDLENMYVRTPDGREVPFSAVATAELGTGYSTINRTDRMRTVTVTADYDLTVGTPREVIDDLAANVMPEIVAKHGPMTYSFEGEQREQRDALGGLVRGFVVALIAIYALMAIPFRSYVQPLVVMSAIPFGFVGAVLGHMILGMNLSLLSGFGIVALAGVVVNDNLVLVSFINRRRAAGLSAIDAAKEAGIVRFRPIVLTSLTTFAGLLPIMLEKSVQAQFLIPMAASLAFGVLFATFISLIFVPTGYVILEDVTRVWRKVRGVEEEGVMGEPAVAGG